MSNRRGSTRRTVCQLLGSLVAGEIGVLASSATGCGRARTSDRNGTEVAFQFVFYCGVVDRIVDESFVLLESDGRTVDEIVVPRSDVLCVSESDRLIVVLEDDDVRRGAPNVPP